MDLEAQTLSGMNVEAVAVVKEEKKEEREGPKTFYAQYTCPALVMKTPEAESGKTVLSNDAFAITAYLELLLRALVK
jgi:hypothetical protein